jgi:hypothetical protein
MGNNGLTFDQAIIAAGGFGNNNLHDSLIGKFQIFMLTFYVLAFSAGGFTTYMYDYLVAKPALLCLN